ncbi:hypothetical protein VNO77_20706 [Canavalia gladiata]|uniref:Uncharacterized protein n=1 Tax=Canavalia gladiata TaxID=3824 RepID=A0AAN9QJL2_CANGL
MVGEDILLGIENVDSETVAVVEIADHVGVGAETVNVVVVENVDVVEVEDENVYAVGVEDENADVEVEDKNADVVGIGVGTGTEAVTAVLGAGADTVTVGGHHEGEIVEGSYIEDVDSAIVIEVVVAIHVGIVVVIVLTGAGTAPVGFVDDAVLVGIHNAYVIVEVRMLGVVIEIDTFVAEAELEIQT